MIMVATKSTPTRSKMPAEWELVSERVETFRKHVRSHFERIGSDAAAQRTALEDAVRKLAKDVENLFAATGDTLRDPALRKDVSAIAAAIRQALQDTIDRSAAKPTLKAVAGGHARTKPAAPKATAPKRATRRTS